MSTNEKCQVQRIGEFPLTKIREWARVAKEKQRPRTPVISYKRQHLKSISQPDNWQKISRTLVGSNNVIRRRRKHKRSTGDVNLYTEDDFTDLNEDVEAGRSTRDSVDYFAKEYDFENTPPASPRTTSVGAMNNDDDEVLDTTCQLKYLHACKILRTSPSNKFLRQLSKSEVSMKHIALGSRGAKACAIALLESPRVTKMHFTNNDLGSDGAAYISEVLHENLYITDLTLSHNKLDSLSLDNLCQELVGSSSIRNLCLSGNRFDEHDVKYIAKLIKESKTLRKLDLSHNCFREEGGSSLSIALMQNDTLEELDLSWNHLRMKGAVSIADSLKINATLQKLNVAWNGFHIQGCKSLSTVLKTNTSLLHLDLTCNRVDTNCLKELLNGLRKNTSLVSLKIGNNPITTSGAISILKVLQEVESVSIQELHITGQSVDATFVQLYHELQETRPNLIVTHGIIVGHEHNANGEDDFLNDDPMMVLMEFMRLQNLRLVDLFTSLDKDGSKSLSYDEFRNGLLSVNIPMSVEGINRLIRKLDEDGDGEVDFSELIAGQKEHKRKLFKLNKKESHMDFEETEIGRISIKLRALLAFKEKSRLAALRNASKLEAGAKSEVG